MNNLSALLIDFNDVEMKNSELLYNEIEKSNEKHNINAFIDTEVVKGEKKYFLFVGIEIESTITKDKIIKYLRNIKIRLETCELFDIREVKIFAE